MIPGRGGAMAMTQARFDGLIQQLEVFATRHPQQYQQRVRGLALLGYAYIALVIVGLLAAIAFLIYIFLTVRLSGRLLQGAFLLLVPLVLIGQSLFVAVPPPQGIILQRTQTPNLFALVNQLSVKLQVPKFYQILLTDEFNAGVVQVPHAGFFAGYKNYLMIGLPLLQALSVNQFRAVLAHELGHISGNHSRFGGWIYRQWSIWAQFQARLQYSNYRHWMPVLNVFLNWYAPFFSAYSFVLRRANEYEADRCAAEISGAKTVAEMLVAIKVKAQKVDLFWSEVYQQVNQQVTPPTDAYGSLAAALKADLTENVQSWLEVALAQKTNTADTHPCLRDRLAALGYTPEQIPALPPDLPSSAAEKLLGNALPALISQLNKSWQEGVATSWQQRHAQVQDLTALADKAVMQKLELEEAWKLAQWAFEHREDDKAVPLLQQCLGQEADHGGANFTLGQILLDRNDDEGVSLVERAMAKHSDYILPGCDLLYGFYEKKGQLQKAQTYESQYKQHQKLLERARDERSMILDTDQFSPHRLPKETVDFLRQQLSQFESIQETFLVQKVLVHFPDSPLYILGIVRKKSWYKLDQGCDDLYQEILQKLTLPDQQFVVVMAESNQFIHRLRQVNVASIYSS
jgi:Zn-dependent protease with chaperone function